jgi:hypothetical protein
LKKKFSIFLLFFSLLSANNLVEIVLPHNEWKLVGVPGPFFEGSGSGSLTTTWYWSKDWRGVDSASNSFVALVDATPTYTAVDSSCDDTYVVCFSLEKNVTDGGTVTQINMASDISSIDYDATLPQRKMFISLDGGTDIDLNITYQSDLEGEDFEIETVVGTESTVYEGSFNSAYGEENPLSLSEKSGTSTTYYLSLRDGGGTHSIIDMNFTNNPGKSGQSGESTDYQEATDRDDMNTTDYLQVFHLNSENSYWETFHSSYSDTYNDFTTLSPGSAYWMKLYDDVEHTTKHGVILGDNNLTTSSYTSLNDGWNMVSFPDGYVRHSPTGLILALDTPNTDDEFIITDEVGRESVTVTIFKVDSSGVSAREIAISVNMAIAGAIEDGNVSESFNIKAYPNDSDGELVLISDKKFRVYDMNSTGGTDDVFGAVTTLGGQYPYDVSTSTYKSTTDLSTTGVASRYGEYSLVVTIPNDGAGAIDGSIVDTVIDMGKVKINSNSAIDLSSGSDVEDLDGLFSADSDIDNDLYIDLDNNDEPDSYILVDYSSSFYIRDYTFTKTFRVDDTVHTDTEIYFYDDNASSYTTISVSNGNNASTIANKINSTIDDTVEANSTGSDYIYITTTSTDLRDFDLKDSTDDDLLTRISSNNNNALGAITKVYSISDLARSDVNKSVYYADIDANDITGTDSISVKIDGSADQTITGSGTEDAGELCIGLVTLINSLSANVYAECNTSTATDTTARLTITGYFSQAGIKEDGANIALDDDNDNTHDYASDWTSASIGGVPLSSADTLTDNLTYLPIYSPDFPTGDSVLQYIRENNYTVNTLLTAVDDGSGSVSWKYLDLTTDVDDWFSQIYDYNLFSVEQERGYFAYLEENEPATITVSPTLSMTFSQHYNSDENTTNFSDAESVQNFPDGTLSVEVSGVEGDATRVVATIQGEDYTMYESTADSEYTLSISKDTIPNLAQSDSNITVTVYDETGNIESDSNIELNLSSPATPVYQFFNGKYMFLGTTSSDLSAFNIYSGRVDDRYPTPSNTSGTTYVNNLTPDNDYKVDGSQYCYGTSGSGVSCNTGTPEIGESLTIAGVPDYGVDENGTVSYEDNNVGKVTNGNHATYYFMTYNLCEDAPDFDTNNSGWVFTAVDGDGDAENSRVSNITHLPDWYAIYQGASILNSGGDSDSNDSYPRLYDSDCNTSSSSDETKDNGVVLFDINTSNDNNLTIAYDTVTTSSINQASPSDVTNVYLQYKDGNMSKIQFYASKYVYSLNSALDNEKVILFDINNTILYKATFDDLYDDADGIFDLYDDAILLDSNQTIIKGD